MKSKAFIIEFQEGMDFVQTYRSLLRNNRFVLRTKIALELGERVKVRFKIPGGNGVTIRCKVATQIDDDAWGITLPMNEDVRWLQEKAVDAEKLLGPAAQRLAPVPKDEEVGETHQGSKASRQEKPAAAPGPGDDSKAANVSTRTPSSGPVTVNIAPGGSAENMMLHFGAPEAEFVDPERNGFPSLKDTGMDLVKELDGDAAMAPGLEPMVVRQSPGQESLNITQVVRGSRRG